MFSIRTYMYVYRSAQPSTGIKKSSIVQRAVEICAGSLLMEAGRKSKFKRGFTRLYNV